MLVLSRLLIHSVKLLLSATLVHSIAVVLSSRLIHSKPLVLLLDFGSFVWDDAIADFDSFCD